MNSLQDLNSYSATSLQVSDSRPATVKFDRVYPLTALNQVVDIVSITTVLDPGINIVEIVNFSTANVRYRVTVQNFGSPAFTGSTVTWASLPSGVSLSSGGGVYTLSGLSTPASWEAVKTITWNLPANYASYPTWNLKSEIIYYDQALGQDVSVSWLSYDPRFYFRAQLTATSTMTVKGTYYRAQGRANRTATAALTCSGRRIASGISLHGSGATLTASLSAVILGLSTKTYYRGTYTQIWSSSSLSIQAEGLPSYTTVGFTVTASSGYLVYESTGFGTNESSTASSYSYDDASLSNVNARFANISYYPVAGATGNVTLTFQIIINGSTTYLTRTMTLTNAGTIGRSFVSDSITYLTSGSWTPSATHLRWGATFDYLLVGGGGGGYWGGGGAGKYIESFSNTMTSGSKSVTIGAGGAYGWDTDAQYVFYRTGQTNRYAYKGEDSSFYGSTASGGQPAGPNRYDVNDQGASTIYRGGSQWNSGSQVTGPYYGGTGGVSTVGTDTWTCGGGGGGSTANGYNTLPPPSGAFYSASYNYNSNTQIDANIAGFGGAGFTSTLLPPPSGYGNGFYGMGGGGCRYLVRSDGSRDSYIFTSTSLSWQYGGGGDAFITGNQGVLVIKVNG